MQTRIYFKTSDGLSPFWTGLVTIQNHPNPIIPANAFPDRGSDWIVTTSECPALPPQTREPVTEPEWHKLYSK